jgi:hypothetical protein
MKGGIIDTAQSLWEAGKQITEAGALLLTDLKRKAEGIGKSEEPQKIVQERNNAIKDTTQQIDTSLTIARVLTVSLPGYSALIKAISSIFPINTTPIIAGAASLIDKVPLIAATIKWGAAAAGGLLTVANIPWFIGGIIATSAIATGIAVWRNRTYAKNLRAEMVSLKDKKARTLQMATDTQQEIQAQEYNLRKQYEEYINKIIIPQQSNLLKLDPTSQETINKLETYNEQLSQKIKKEEQLLQLENASEWELAQHVEVDENGVAHCGRAKIAAIAINPDHTYTLLPLTKEDYGKLTVAVDANRPTPFYIAAEIEQTSDYQEGQITQATLTFRSQLETLTENSRESKPTRVSLKQQDAAYNVQLYNRLGFSRENTIIFPSKEETDPFKPTFIARQDSGIFMFSGGQGQAINNIYIRLFRQNPHEVKKLTGVFTIQTTASE